MIDLVARPGLGEFGGLGRLGGGAHGVVGVDGSDAGGCPGQALHDGVVRLARGFCHAYAGLHGTHDGVAGGKRQPRLLDLMELLLLRGIERRADGHLLADQRDVALAREDIATGNVQRFAGLDERIAFDAADRAGGVDDLLAIDPVGLLAGAITEAAHCAEAGLLDHLVVVAVLGVLAGQEVHVAFGGQDQVLLRADIRPRHVQIAPGHQHGRIARKGRGLGLFPVAGGDGVRGLGREEALGLVADLVVGRAGFCTGGQVDVAPRAHRQLLAGGDFGRARVDVLARDQREVAARRDGRADLRAGAQAVTIPGVQDQGFTMAFSQGFQRDVAAGLQTRVVLDRDLRRGQRDVTSGL
ncbi:hypothetical protein LMG6003_05946 [Achromobacter insolitus]|nr:hypothetical protein LMG6003_05946 [Achromobacter insolitus]